MGKFKEFLASDSELVMRPIREFLGFDSEKKTESGWATLYDNEGAPYRVHIEEKVAEAAARKAEKEAQKQKEKEQSAEDKKEIADYVAKNEKELRDYIQDRKTPYEKRKLGELTLKTLEKMKKGEFKSLEEVRKYGHSEEFAKQVKEIKDRVKALKDKFNDAAIRNWNGKINEYKDGTKTAYMNGGLIKLTDEESEYLKSLHSYNRNGLLW